MLLGFGDAGEGGGYKGTLEVFGGCEGWGAGRDGEDINEFEDEEAGEGTAKVGDAVVTLVTRIKGHPKREKAKKDVRSQ